MKTFNTENNNIPEGATHYSDESVSDCFAWFKSELGINYLWCPGIEGEEYWIALNNQSEVYGEEVKPIPQTKEVCTEDTTKWVNGLPPVGAKCEALFIEHEHKGYGEFLVLGYHGSYVWMEYIGELSNTSEHFTSKVSLIKFRKPETEAERIKRERLENGKTFYQLMSDIETSVMNPEDSGYPNEWDELRDDWQEVYMRQAEALGFKKG